jgi:hypothetical protein
MKILTCMAVTLKFLVGIFSVFLFFIYLNTTIYNFDRPSKFIGSTYYNPYKNWDRNNTFKANFHAHSLAWGGITNGANTSKTLRVLYKRLGYKLVCISNYQDIDSQYIKGQFCFGAYEHGYNLFKRHQLVIEPKAVTFFDFPLFQNLSQKQQVLDKLSKSEKYVIIAHPNLREGYQLGDFDYLSNYDFVEVLSNYANAIPYWDRALSSGHKVWCLANDDTHNLKDQPLGQYYNLVSGNSDSKIQIEAALSDGDFLVIRKKNSDFNVSLSYLTIKNDSISYQVNGVLDGIRVISDGEVIATLHSIEGNLVFPKTASYVRFEFYQGDNLILTNPIFRNKVTPIQKHRTNYVQTWLYRLGVVMSGVILWLILFPKIL